MFKPSKSNMFILTFRDYLCFNAYKKLDTSSRWLQFKNSSGILSHKLWKKHIRQERKLKFRTYRNDSYVCAYYDKRSNFRTRHKYRNHKVTWLNAREKSN